MIQVEKFDDLIKIRMSIAKIQWKKAVQKVVNEFRRYADDLNNQSEKANPADLLSGLAIVKSLIEHLKIR